MKFVLFVEGYTEQKVLPDFFRRWLDPRLKRRVGLQTVRFDGWPELIRDSGTKAGMYLRQIPRIMARICQSEPSSWDACRATGSDLAIRAEQLLGRLPSNFGTLAEQLWDACRATLGCLPGNFGMLAGQLWDACRATGPDLAIRAEQLGRLPGNWGRLPGNFGMPGQACGGLANPPHHGSDLSIRAEQLGRFAGFSLFTFNFLISFLT